MALRQRADKEKVLSKREGFLKKINPRPSTLQLLGCIYPTVDWKRVDFFEGLPWFTPLLAPYVSAQALPAFYSLGRYRIYLRRFDEARAQCLADIVHEGYHVLQGMQFAKGYGLGPFRGFTIFYASLFMKHGYRYHPFEIPAFDQEFRFLDLCERHGLHGVIPAIRPNELRTLCGEKELVTLDFHYRYRESKWRLALGVLGCLLLALLFPLIDLLAFIVLSVKRHLRSNLQKSREHLP